MLEYILLTGALSLLFFLGRYKPSIAASLLPFFLPLYLFRLAIFSVPTNVLELAILIIAMAHLTRPQGIHEWRQSYRLLPPKIVLLIWLFIIAAIISTIISPHHYSSLGILKGWILFPILAGWLVWIQAQGQSTSSLLNNLSLTGLIIAWLGLIMPDISGRLVGIYDVPNSLALFLAPIIVIAWWRVLLPAPARSSTEKICLISTASLMTIALIGTQSVSGITAVFASLVVGLFLWRPVHLPKIIISITVLAILSAAYLGYTGKLTYLAGSAAGPSNSTSLAVRLQLWSIGTELVGDHPVLGIGLGVFEPAYQQKLHERFIKYDRTHQSDQNLLNATARQYVGRELAAPIHEFVFRDPHNWIISFWLNLGVLGLISFAGINVFVIVGTLSSLSLMKDRPTRRTDGPHVSAQAIMLALLTLLIFGLTDTIYWKNDLATLYFILIALLLGLLGKNKKTTPRSPQQLLTPTPTNIFLKNSTPKNSPAKD